MKSLGKRVAIIYLAFLFALSLSSGILVGTDWYKIKQLKVYKYTPYEIDKHAFLSPPSLTHILGTDAIGRDIAARLIKGTANSFLISFVATVVSLILGLFFGGLAGYLGGVFDFVFSRVFELFYSLPILFTLILFSMLIGESLIMLGIVLGFLGWLFIARLFRSEVIKLKSSDFVRYARANGGGFLYLFRKHFFPHAFPSIMTVAIFSFSGMLVAESSLSFLGLGVKPPEPSWGEMIYEGMSFLGVAPWIYVPPSVMLFFTILSLDVLGRAIKRQISRF